MADAVTELEGRLPAMGRTSFRDPHRATCTTRIEIIVRFLALLELCKRGRVSLDQGQTLRRPRRDLDGGAPPCRWRSVPAGVEEYEG